MRRVLRHIMILAALATAFVSCGKEDAAVPEEIAYGVDGELRLQKKWAAAYLGRYNAAEEGKHAEYIDRLSATGTGDAMYYHVIARQGSIKSDEQLLEAFRDGCGVGNTKGGKALIELFYALSSLRADQTVSLSDILACGGPEDDGGYMDYSIGETGIFDVYVVEMQPDGRISGRYGMTSIEITGTPMISDVFFVSGADLHD